MNGEWLGLCIVAGVAIFLGMLATLVLGVPIVGIPLLVLGMYVSKQAIDKDT